MAEDCEEAIDGFRFLDALGLANCSTQLADVPFGKARNENSCPVVKAAALDTVIAAGRGMRIDLAVGNTWAEPGHRCCFRVIAALENAVLPMSHFACD